MLIHRQLDEYESFVSMHPNSNRSGNSQRSKSIRKVSSEFEQFFSVLQTFFRSFKSYKANVTNIGSISGSNLERRTSIHSPITDALFVLTWNLSISLATGTLCMVEVAPLLDDIRCNPSRRSAQIELNSCRASSSGRNSFVNTCRSVALIVFFSDSCDFRDESVSQRVTYICLRWIRTE